MVKMTWVGPLAGAVLDKGGKRPQSLRLAERVHQSPLGANLVSSTATTTTHPCLPDLWLCDLGQEQPQGQWGLGGCGGSLPCLGGRDEKHNAGKRWGFLGTRAN
jgi:hypothetical protein